MTDAENQAPLLVMGATEGIGRCVVLEAMERDLPVRAFARGIDPGTARPGFEPVQGDALSAGDVRRAVAGSRAVIVALGITERLSMLWEKETLFSRSAHVLVEAMAAEGVKRVVVVTGFGAGRSRTAMSGLERLGHGALLGRVYADKTRQEEIVMASGLDWTIARPVILRNGDTGRLPRVLRDPAHWRNGLVGRREVARYLVSSALDPTDIGADVVLTR
ncbi:NAD(P)-dependent oxidoreductase [Pseudaestuariivita atlantica]|uniref:NAD(P)-binding domain-containing protein n=1 Tax=Pseudaestuariivita atlantica TaxID=1317121 RepID=A0A0L1JMH3_9RHOB|nr:NAD(P)-binding oxidoreductase [Pseudaestuariivita atlantica]KNG92946.1 hypothetical protein ATO11_13495 [Pseudaestuariivita atlantica]